MADDPLKGISPGARELAEKLGMDLSKVFGDRYISSDQRMHSDPRSAIEANLNFEQTSGGNQGTTGGCGQDASKVPGK
jgi:hypothetical protein